MKYLYGEFSDSQVDVNARLMHGEIHKLLLKNYKERCIVTLWKEITYEEYKQLKKRYKEKPSTLINSGGMTFPKEMLDLADQRAKEKMKFENNPMELTD